MGWKWNQLDQMQIICTLLQTDNYVSTSSLTGKQKMDMSEMSVICE